MGWILHPVRAHEPDPCKEGETVRIGQRIGKVGSTGMSTGNHLHFELQKNGRLLDPVEWFGRRF